MQLKKTRKNPRKRNINPEKDKMESQELKKVFGFFCLGRMEN